MIPMEMENGIQGKVSLMGMEMVCIPLMNISISTIIISMMQGLNTVFKTAAKIEFQENPNGPSADFFSTSIIQPVIVCLIT